MNKYAIILAAGHGQRMHTTQPKQLLTLYRKPLWYYATKAFLESFKDIQIIITTLPNHREKIQYNLRQYFPRLYNKIQITNGGIMRFDSVKNALDCIPKNQPSIIAIHDSARCLVQTKMIQRLYKTALKYKSAIPIVSATDSIRYLHEKQYEYLNRNAVFYVQTPQVFYSDWLFKSFNTPYQEKFTDDASVIEHAGYNLHFVEGDISNIKVTYLVDIEIVKWHLKNRDK